MDRPQVVIDCHVHVFRDPLRSSLLKWVPRSAEGTVGEVRRRARNWMKPFTSSMHRAQTLVRYLPQPVLKRIDQFSGFAPLPNLLVEGTLSDLREEMKAADIDRAVIIAHPARPLAIPNEFVLDICGHDPNFIPAVNISSGTSRPGLALKSYVHRGARFLKIHPAADGEGVDSPRYRALLRVAADMGLPVILHTGCLHTHLLYKTPEQGEVQRFAPWFEKYKNVRFILAHMNFHNPNIALDLAEEHDNLFVDTSWQPAEIIGEAVRRIGADRVLFGTDWPIVGGNLSVGRSRIRDCLSSGLLNESQSRLILGENITKMLAVSVKGDEPNAV